MIESSRYPRPSRESVHLLFHRALQHQRIGDDSLTGLYAGDDFLRVVRERRTCNDVYSTELFSPVRDVYPITIVQMQHGRRWHDSASLGLSSVERRGNKHSDLHHARITNFDADLG